MSQLTSVDDSGVAAVRGGPTCGTAVPVRAALSLNTNNIK